ncbi:MAG TPA: hypothetical protein VIA62_07580 [Thermoanaerobaculia bacterium]|jgi:hypothetical protein|nr:hypothetical protein [Thermoanaerobaculia bacterium]
MKTAKTILYAVVILGAIVAFGWFFVSQLSSGASGTSGGSGGLAGVILSPPEGYAIVERGELPPTEAAAELQSQALQPGAGKVGVKFQRQGAVVYWLADVPGDLLEERAAGSSGTRLQTVWQGGLRDRLSWARDHGDFSAPGLPPGEKKNLYH